MWWASIEEWCYNDVIGTQFIWPFFVMIRHRWVPIRLVIFIVGPPDYQSLYLIHYLPRYCYCSMSPVCGLLSSYSKLLHSCWTLRCVGMLWEWYFNTHILPYAASWIWFYTRLETTVIVVYFNRLAQCFAHCSSPEAKNATKFRRLDLSPSSGGNGSGATCWESHAYCNTPLPGTCTFKYKIRAVYQSRAEEPVDGQCPQFQSHLLLVLYISWVKLIVVVRHRNGDTAFLRARVHKFWQNSGATSDYMAPETRHKANSILLSLKYLAPPHKI